MIQAALLVLVNLVCPPPSVCSRPVPAPNTPATIVPPPSNQPPTTAVNFETKGWTSRGEILLDKNGGGVSSAAVVGDRRISLGPGSGGSALAAYMEQGYRFAREAVRSNNGIKVLLHLLHPRTVLPPTALDCIRALACRVLLGLARDDTIAHILTKLQACTLCLFLHAQNSSFCCFFFGFPPQVGFSTLILIIVLVWLSLSVYSTLAV